MWEINIHVTLWEFYTLILIFWQCKLHEITAKVWCLFNIILFSGDLIQNGRIMKLSTSLPEYQILLLEKAFSDPVLFFNWVKCDNKQFNSFSCKDLKFIGSSF